MWWEHIYGENTTQVVAGIRGNAKIVVCLYASRLPPCSTHKARGSSSPAPASINQPSGSHLPLALRWQCRAGLLSDMTNAAKKSLQADAVLYLFACVYCSVFVLRCQPAMIRGGSKLKTIPIYTHYYTPQRAISDACWCGLMSTYIQNIWVSEQTLSGAS